MDEQVKWTKYLWVSLLSFAAFMLEYFSIFVIEKRIIGVDIWNYTLDQRGNHCIIMAVLWALVTIAILSYTQKQYGFPGGKRAAGRISSRDWIFALVCLACCKIMTFIDWHTLKVIGELQGKNLYQFCAQYVYYVFEVGLVLLIIIYGQKAIETLKKEKSVIPYGGLILAVTWGSFHFVSRGVGLEIWNGVSTMIFSVLSGFMYLKLERKPVYSYLFIATGYLL